MLAGGSWAIGQQELFIMSDDDENVFDTDAERKRKFKDRVRYPLVMDVHKIEFEPDVPLLVVTRSSYDLLLNEESAIQLHAMLSEWLKTKQYKDARIRFIGDVSDK